MQLLKIALRFLRFYFSAKTKYDVHSPFVFEFTVEVLEDKRSFYAFYDIEMLRKLLLRDKTKLRITDFGAGSTVAGQKERSIRNIARHSATDSFFCQVLFRIINLYKPSTILEMGTSLGISTLYQASAALNSQFITLEGDPNISKQAQKNLDRLEAEHVQLITGTFKKTLIPALKKIKKLDYVFIDGNHRLKPTIEYFEQCLEFAHENSIFVFDDIHWSEEMEAAWEKVKEHPEVTLSIDLFFCGVVFFKKSFKEKEHYKIVPARWKPWRLGFF